MTPAIPDDMKHIFADLPHINPFFDISNAMKFIIPLKTSYAADSPLVRQAQVIRKANDLLICRLDSQFVKRFHRLAEEFLKEYRTNFQDERIKELIMRLNNKKTSEERESVDLSGIYVREAILKQDSKVREYFNNFYLMSVEYLYHVDQPKFPS